jgi:hypothetical protein
LFHCSGCASSFGWWGFDQGMQLQSNKSQLIIISGLAGAKEKSHFQPSSSSMSLLVSRLNSRKIKLEVL